MFLLQNLKVKVCTWVIHMHAPALNFLFKFDALSRRFKLQRESSTFERLMKDDVTA